MADPAPTERPMPLGGHRFRPTDLELVAHYLRRKLMAHEPSIYNIIPEIDVCKYEPWDLLALAASAASATQFDDFQCFFFSRCHYKFPNSTRRNRTTSHGFWKVTGKDRKIIDWDTNNVIGTKKNLVFYEGSSSKGQITNWVIHEYHDAFLPSEQRTHVLCWLKEKNKKKIKKITHHLLDDERGLNNSLIFEDENQSNTCMSSEEQYSLNMNSTIQIPSQLNDATDSMTQPTSLTNEVTDSMTQPAPLTNEVTDSMTQPAPLTNEVTDSMIQLTPLSNETTDSMTQPTPFSNEVTDSMTQLVPLSNKVTNSMTQPARQLNEATDHSLKQMIRPLVKSDVATNLMSQSYSQLNEVKCSMILTPSEPNSTLGAMFDAGEFESNLFSLWELPPAPSMDDIGPSNSMILTSSEPNSTVRAMFDAVEFESNLFSRELPPAPSMDEIGPSNSMILTPSELNSTVGVMFDVGEFESSLFSLWELPPAPNMDEIGLSK